MTALVWTPASRRTKYTVLAASAFVVLTGSLVAAGLAAQAHNSDKGDWSNKPAADQQHLAADGAPQPVSSSSAQASQPQDPASPRVDAPAAAAPSAAPPPPAQSAPKPRPKPKPRPRPPVPPAADGSVAQRLLFYINTKRAAHGLYAYKMSPRLAKASTLHSQCMAAEHRLSHLCRGEKPIGERFIGVPWRGASENAGQENASSSTASILAACERSTDAMLGEGPGGGHYENLMSNSSDFIGIGVVRTSDGMVWLTQDFVNSP